MGRVTYFKEFSSVSNISTSGVTPMMFIAAINSFVINPDRVHRSREMWEFPCGSTHVPTTGSSVSTISLDTLINRLISALQRGRDKASEIPGFLCE